MPNIVYPLMAGSLFGGILAQLIGSGYGVIVGFLAALICTKKLYEKINPFKTDADRVLESLAKRDQDAMLKVSLTIFFAGALIGIVAERIFIDFTDFSAFIGVQTSVLAFISLALAFNKK